MSGLPASADGSVARDWSSVPAEGSDPTAENLCEYLWSSTTRTGRRALRAHEFLLGEALGLWSLRAAKYAPGNLSRTLLGSSLPPSENLPEGTPSGSSNPAGLEARTTFLPYVLVAVGVKFCEPRRRQAHTAETPAVEPVKQGLSGARGRCRSRLAPRAGLSGARGRCRSRLAPRAGRTGRVMKSARTQVPTCQEKEENRAFSS